MGYIALSVIFFDAGPRELAESLALYVSPILCQASLECGLRVLPSMSLLQGHDDAIRSGRRTWLIFWNEQGGEPRGPDRC